MDSISLPLLPILTAEKFADHIGLPLGVVEAALDRRLYPVMRIGKRRFINLELLRKQALAQEHFLS